MKSNHQAVKTTPRYCSVAMEFKGFLLLLLGLLFGVAFASPDGNHSSQVCQPECPTWFVPVYKNGTMSCVCGDSLGGVVLCEEESNISLLFQYCMTYDDVNNSTACSYCPYHYHKPDVQGLYVKLPQNVCDLNEFMCGGLNRTGLLCSDCKPGLGPAVFSYTLQCLKCLEGGYGWLLFMFLATFPTTVLLLVVFLCQIRITAAPMNAFIFACQGIVSVVDSSPSSYLDAYSKPGYYLAMFLLTVYGIFNLDFFRYIIPQFCVSSTMTTVQALSLEYIVAFYPLLLTIIFYICIQLYARDCKLLVYLWKPFHKCFVRMPQKWSPLESLVHTFAAFLLLSYSKILTVSLSLLQNQGYARDSSGEKVGPLTIYYNATVPYFSTEHLPFALLAIFISATFIAFPVLILLLYPTRLFQRCIGCCSTRWHALDAFVDAFQGYYKDGTNGTPDWRYFSGLYLIFRILVVGAYALPHTTEECTDLLAIALHLCFLVFCDLIRKAGLTTGIQLEQCYFHLQNLLLCLINTPALVLCFYTDWQLYLWYISLCIQAIKCCLKWPFFTTVLSVVRTGLMKVVVFSV